MMKNTNSIMKYFEYDHLPEHLQAVSKPIGELAMQLCDQLPDGPEKSAGLRKLLEAKDCLVKMIFKFFRFCRMSKLCDFRCSRCETLLAKVSKQGNFDIQIKCRKCKTINSQSIKYTSKA